MLDKTVNPSDMTLGPKKYFRVFESSERYSREVKVWRNRKTVVLGNPVLIVNSWKLRLDWEGVKASRIFSPFNKEFTGLPFFIFHYAKLSSIILRNIVISCQAKNVNAYVE
jgi:hypothetical protein